MCVFRSRCEFFWPQSRVGGAIAALATPVDPPLSWVVLRVELVVRIGEGRFDMWSEEDADRGLQFTMWCRACGHTHHTLSHVKRHFKLHVDHRPYGTHCGCCDDILGWQEQVCHVNWYHAHQCA